MNEKASLLLFLNKTGFKGLYRENNHGKLNVPFGNYKTPSIYSKEQLKELNKVFNMDELKITFICQDFKKAFENVKKGDFVYLDPPYAPVNKTSFTKYDGEGFGDKDHNDLKNICHKIIKNGAKFVHSNSDCKYNLKLYENFNIQKVNSRRRINSKNPENITTEIIIYSD